MQQLVVDGAAEIVKNYDVDGIHLDDYFYPGTDFADEATYERYGQDFSKIGDWRRDNVNTLIAALAFFRGVFSDFLIFMNGDRFEFTGSDTRA